MKIHCVLHGHVNVIMMMMLQFFVLAVLSLESESLRHSTSARPRRSPVRRRCRRVDAPLTWLDVVDSVEGTWLW